MKQKIRIILITILILIATFLLYLSKIESDSYLLQVKNENLYAYTHAVNIKYMYNGSIIKNITLRVNNGSKISMEELKNNLPTPAEGKYVLNDETINQQIGNLNIYNDYNIEIPVVLEKGYIDIEIEFPQYFPIDDLELSIAKEIAPNDILDGPKKLRSKSSNIAIFRFNVNETTFKENERTYVIKGSYKLGYTITTISNKKYKIIDEGVDVDIHYYDSNTENLIGTKRVHVLHGTNIDYDTINREIPDQKYRYSKTNHRDIFINNSMNINVYLNEFKNYISAQLRIEAPGVTANQIIGRVELNNQIVQTNIPGTSTSGNMGEIKFIGLNNLDSNNNKIPYIISVLGPANTVITYEDNVFVVRQGAPHKVTLEYHYMDIYNQDAGTTKLFTKTIDMLHGSKLTKDIVRSYIPKIENGRYILNPKTPEAEITGPGTLKVLLYYDRGYIDQKFKKNPPDANVNMSEVAMVYINEAENKEYKGFAEKKGENEYVARIYLPMVRDDGTTIRYKLSAEGPKNSQLDEEEDYVVVSIRNVTLNIKYVLDGTTIHEANNTYKFGTIFNYDIVSENLPVATKGKYKIFTREGINEMPLNGNGRATVPVVLDPMEMDVNVFYPDDLDLSRVSVSLIKDNSEIQSGKQLTKNGENKAILHFENVPIYGETGEEVLRYDYDFTLPEGYYIERRDENIHILKHSYPVNLIYNNENGEVKRQTLIYEHGKSVTYDDAKQYIPSAITGRNLIRKSAFRNKRIIAPTDININLLHDKGYIEKEINNNVGISTDNITVTLKENNITSEDADENPKHPVDIGNKKLKIQFNIPQYTDDGEPREYTMDYEVESGYKIVAPSSPTENVEIVKDEKDIIIIYSYNGEEKKREVIKKVKGEKLTYEDVKKYIPETTEGTYKIQKRTYEEVLVDENKEISLNMLIDKGYIEKKIENRANVPVENIEITLKKDGEKVNIENNPKHPEKVDAENIKVRYEVPEYDENGEIINYEYDVKIEPVNRKVNIKYILEDREIASRNISIKNGKTVTYEIVKQNLPTPEEGRYVIKRDEFSETRIDRDNIVINQKVVHDRGYVEKEINNPDNIPANLIKVVIKENNQKVDIPENPKTATDNGDNKAIVRFDLPKYDEDGNENNYTYEIIVPEGYEVEENTVKKKIYDVNVKYIDSLTNETIKDEIQKVKHGDKIIYTPIINELGEYIIDENQILENITNNTNVTLKLKFLKNGTAESYENKIKELENKLEKCKEKHKEKDEKIINLENIIKELEKQEKDAEIKKLENEIEKIKENSKQDKEQIIELGNKIDKLEKDIQDKDTKIADLVKIIEELRNKIATLEKEKEKAEEENKLKDKNIEALKEENSKFKKEKEELEKKIKELEKKAELADGKDKEDLIKEIEKLQEKNRELENKIKNVEEKNNKLEKDKEELNKKIQELEEKNKKLTLEELERSIRQKEIDRQKEKNSKNNSEKTTIDSKKNNNKNMNNKPSKKIPMAGKKENIFIILIIIGSVMFFITRKIKSKKIKSRLNKKKI